VASPRLLSVGYSSTDVCGVRDAADVLANELGRMGFDVGTRWCERVGVRRSETRRLREAWLARLRRDLDSGAVDAVIFHYSTWAYGVRGFPVQAPHVSGALAASPVPVVGFLHELALPFRLRGWRGATQAVAQRIALVPVVRACDAVLVTTEERTAWLRSRRWLPKRPTRFVPVFSNLPPAERVVQREQTATRVGIFGFASPGVEIEAVGEALRLLEVKGRQIELVLIGSPGPESQAAAAWRAACSAHVTDLRFTGVRPADEVSAELAAVDVVLFPDRGGASSRRGTLAAALAAGRPIVAMEGHEQWPRLVAENAVALTPPSPAALAAVLDSFCTDEGARFEQGRRGERFYRTHMAPPVAAEAIVSMLRELGVAAGVPTLAGAA
jgi:glycosyltransferase involved in cell wall biosynthesis